VPAAASNKIEADEGRTDNWLSAKKAKPHASLVLVQIAMSAGGFEVRQRRFARCDFRRRILDVTRSLRQQGAVRYAW
jgi:hypothetical protein